MLAHTCDRLKRRIASWRALLALAAFAIGACERVPAPRPRTAPPLASVRADTALGERLPVLSARPASLWLTRVTTAPPPVRPRAAGADVPLPEAAPDSVPAAAPAAETDASLRPPILRTPGVLEVPAGAAGASLVLDVRVDERGLVTEARPSDPGADPAQVAAAERCALGMRFYPAQRAGRPVAVWCRQRFEFGRR